MKTNYIIISILSLLLISGAVFAYINSDSAKPSNEMMKTEETSESMMLDEKKTEDEKMIEESSMMKSEVNYIEYSSEAFNLAVNKRRVLFFYASWCPTCKPANEEFLATKSIPEDVVLFRVNYDTEASLKNKYGITYQHTFVQVDKDGNEITKWNGGGVSKLLESLK